VLLWGGGGGWVGGGVVGFWGVLGLGGGSGRSENNGGKFRKKKVGKAEEAHTGGRRDFQHLKIISFTSPEVGGRRQKRSVSMNVLQS